jgi:hypothetical protein
MPSLRSKVSSTMHMQRLSPSPPLACAGAVCLLIITLLSPDLFRLKAAMPQPRQWSSLPYMSHESQLRDTLFIIAEPDSRSMAVDLHGIYVTCFHCQESAQSCLLGAGDAHHCLVAQGWFKSPAKSKNWSCPTCATGYWVAPNEDLVKCCHLETLQYRKRGMIEWRLTTEAEQAAAETPEAVPTEITLREACVEIALELELTGNRLIRLAERLRSATAQR